MTKIKAFSIIFIALIQTGCFEIIEEVNLNNDGDGFFKFTINFSQSSNKIKSLLLMDEVEGYAVPTQQKIKVEFEKVCASSKKIPELSNIAYTSDLDNFIFEYQCNFTDVHQINAAVDTMITNTGNKDSTHTAYFNYSKKDRIFNRKSNNLLKHQYLQMTDAQRIIFSGADYTSIYRFESEIKSVDRDKGQISANKKALLHKIKIISVTRNGYVLNKRIHLQ
jgi:hypothetical protein